MGPLTALLSVSLVSSLLFSTAQSDAPPQGDEPLALQSFQSAAVDEENALDRIGVVDPSTGIWYLRGANAQVANFYYGNPGDYPFVGDWDCDGEDTPGLYRQSDGFVYLRNSNTQGVADVRFFFGNPGDIPLAGDFDGDGCDTVSIYRPSEARIYVTNKLGSDEAGLGAADYFFDFGVPGDKPFVGDFNGDGIDTVGLHREGTGLVYFRYTNTTGIADHSFIYGDPGDRLVAGDWGVLDGVDSPAVFRPSTSTFYFRFTNTQGVADETLVQGPDGGIPVAGRWTSPAEEADNPEGSLDDPEQGASLPKDHDGQAGGGTSDVGEPPEGEGGGVELTPNAQPAPEGMTIDPTVAAPAGAVQSDEFGETSDEWAGIPYLWAVDESDGLTTQFCNGGQLISWGYNCPNQYYFPHDSGWLHYDYLPQAVGQVGPTGCTGTLVARNVVLTAAHCVAPWNGTFYFVPDLYGGLGTGTYKNVGNPGYYWSGSRAIYHHAYHSKLSSVFDYAFIVLNKNSAGQHAGDIYGWVDVYNLSGASQSQAKGYYEWDVSRYSYGYPAEGWWSKYGNGPYPNELYDAVPWYCGSNDGWYYHHGGGWYSLGFGCTAAGGQSGGPIWQIVNGQWSIVSVNSTMAYMVSCGYYGLQCKARDGFPTGRYFGKNVWGPALINTAYAGYGYDDLWWALYNTNLDGYIVWP